MSVRVVHAGPWEKLCTPLQPALPLLPNLLSLILRLSPKTGETLQVLEVCTTKNSRLMGPVYVRHFFFFFSFIQKPQASDVVLVRRKTWCTFVADKNKVLIDAVEAQKKKNKNIKTSVKIHRTFHEKTEVTVSRWFNIHCHSFMSSLLSDVFNAMVIFPVSWYFQNHSTFILLYSSVAAIMIFL